MGYISSLRCVGLKLESSKYTSPQTDLAQGDYNFKAYNISYSPEIEEAKRKYATVYMSSLSSVMGKRKGTISFSIDLAWSGAANTSPEWSKLMQACGLKETAFTTTGISWTPNKGYTNVPAVVEVQEIEEGASFPKGLTIKLRGAMGNCKLVLDTVGKPLRADFEFTGPLVEIEDRASPITPSFSDASVAEAVLSSAMTAYAESLDLDAITLDFGNKIEVWSDPTLPEGYSGAHIVDREPTLQINPFLASIATRSYWSRLTAGTTGALYIPVGSNLKISAPAIQIVKAFDGGVRNGATANTLNCILNRSSGDDEFEILQGSKT